MTVVSNKTLFFSFLWNSDCVCSDFLWLFRRISETTNYQHYPLFQAFAAKLMRSALFRDITRRRVVIVYRRFGTTYRSHLHGSRVRVGKKASLRCLYPPLSDIKPTDYYPARTFPYRINVIGCWLSFFPARTLDPWRWDRYVVPKRR
jgi:hypothetical protein